VGRRVPQLDGMRLLSRLRSRSTETRVLILSAKDAVTDRVRGLEAGADDYLTKPFAFTELVARVKALARRRYDTTDTRVRIGDLVIDLSDRHVERAGRPVELTRHEFMLLEFLALRRARVVTRQEIEEQLYDARRDPLSNVVDAAVCRLRRKIDGTSDAPLIHTRRGVGYSLGTMSA